MDPLSRVHLNGLRAVEAAGRFGSLAKAAAYLGVSVGAVSQQVLKTEAQLGRTLFERTPHGLVPTAFGKAFLDRLRPGFRQLTAAVELVEPRPETCLTVSVAPVLASKWLVPRLGEFTSKRPDLTVRIDATVAFADFNSGEVDVGLRVGKGGWTDVRAEHLIDQRIFPVASPAVAARLRSPGDLGSVPIVRDVNSVLSWDTWLGAVGLDVSILRPGQMYSDAGLCLDAVIAGQGVMLAWHTLAADALKAGLVVAPFPQAVLTGHAYYVVSSPNRRPRAIETVFKRWVAEKLSRNSATTAVPRWWVWQPPTTLWRCVYRSHDLTGSRLCGADRSCYGIG